jgi:DNA polymerase III delta prime subunit
MSRRPLKFKPGTAELADDDPIGIDELRDALGHLAEIKMPKDADEPILAGRTRLAVYEWLFEIRAAADLKAVGLKPRQSALLFGPPGCGKTTLAHHLAARLGQPLVVANFAAILGSPYRGQDGAHLLQFFTAIRNYGEPVVVLLDELDSVGGKRIEGTQAAAKEQNATLNHLLVMVEQFEGMLIGATNREDDLDPALWRRFGMQLSVDLPGPDEVYAILKRYGAPFVFEEPFLDMLAKISEGASPSLLRQLMEGLKRAIVLGPRMKRSIDDPAVLLAGVIEAVKPPPEFDPPPLWRNPKNVQRLAGLPWPPTRPEPS